MTGPARLRELLLVAAAVTAACGDTSLDPTACERAGDVCLVAGTGALGYNGDGHEADATDLYLVSAARPGPDGRLYLADFNNQRIRVIDGAGTITTLAGNGVHAVALEGAPAAESPLENPVDLDFLPDGRMLLAQLHDPRVFVVDGGRLVRLAGVTEYGNTGDGGPALEARFEQITAVVALPGGDVVVADGLAHRLRRIDAAGGIVAFAGTGEEGHAGDGGPAILARLAYPEALAAGPSGEVYVADSAAHVVRRVDAGGTITTVAGSGVPGSSGDGGPATSAALTAPRGVAVDGAGVLYIADSGNHCVRHVLPDGTIETVAGTGERGRSGDGGPASAAMLAGPANLELSPDGRELFVADQRNSVVRKLRLR
jgi:hypothetical protein